MSTAGASPYLRWKKSVDSHDYAAAFSYLSIRFGGHRAAAGFTTSMTWDELIVFLRSQLDAQLASLPPSE